MIMKHHTDCSPPYTVFFLFLLPLSLVGCYVPGRPGSKVNGTVPMVPEHLSEVLFSVLLSGI